ncbi:hypothetical protein [Gandjariella thermophila]|uniref:Uncharacterized protein n=1 Tax=Gandjariella thermophila TaxID=1931992 RepID=A0A4D4J4Z9_9PSEU|nr:hypothetical protein [Gandjariella thermophila]GDY29057.1 hypothetical protein GTS_06900 [Gandjariella thermophila]
MTATGPAVPAGACALTSVGDSTVNAAGVTVSFVTVGAICAGPPARLFGFRSSAAIGRMWLVCTLVRNGTVIPAGVISSSPDVR